MNIAALFALIVVGIVGWWLFARQLTAKPWERKQIEADDDFAGATLALAPAKVGLWFFLAVITSFFGLLISAYGMRMELADWRPLPVPDLLWFNTGMLVLSSVAFQWTRVLAQRADANGVKAGLAASGLFAVVFLAGQWLAWQQLYGSGQYLVSDVASAFFYLLTGLHGLHLIGGLYVWGKATARVWLDSSQLRRVRASIELCSVYWHFLLLVWLVLFAVLLTRSTLRNIWLGICSAVGIGQ